MRKIIGIIMFIIAVLLIIYSGYCVIISVSLSDASAINGVMIPLILSILFTSAGFGLIDKRSKNKMDGK